MRAAAPATLRSRDPAQAARHLRQPQRRVRCRPGRGETLTAVAVCNHYKRVQAVAGGEVDVELQNRTSSARAHRLQQDVAGPDPRADPQRTVRDRRRDRAHRSRLRRRGRREHPPQAHPGGGTSPSNAPRPASSTSTRSTRSARKADNPSIIARRVGRGRAAGAPQDPRGRWRACRRRAAQAPHQESLTSRRRSQCSSSVGAPSPGSRRSSSAASARRPWLRCHIAGKAREDRGRSSATCFRGRPELRPRSRNSSGRLPDSVRYTTSTW